MEVLSLFPRSYTQFAASGLYFSHAIKSISPFIIGVVAASRIWTPHNSRRTAYDSIGNVPHDISALAGKLQQ